MSFTVVLCFGLGLKCLLFQIAVIYHDFHVLVSVAKRHSTGTLPDVTHSSDTNSEKHVDYHEIPVKDLKLNQLKLLMVSQQIIVGQSVVVATLNLLKINKYVVFE